MRPQCGLRRLVLVGERGLLTDTRSQTLRECPGWGWSAALRQAALRQLAACKSILMSLFEPRNLAQITVPLDPDERLVVGHNPALAARRKSKPEALLVTTEEAFQRSQHELQGRARKPLSALTSAKQAARAQPRFQVGKHFETILEDGHCACSRRKSSLAPEAALAGLDVLRTSPTDRAAEDVVRSHKQLAGVERAFRCRKPVDLQVRRLRPRHAQRGRTHLCLCRLSHSGAWQLRQALAALLVQD